MTYDPERHHRRSIRLRDYDYSVAGAYFVTICTYDRACVFGEVFDGTMRPSAAAETVARAWDALPDRFPTILLDAFVVTPNHVHGIVLAGANGDAVVTEPGTASRAPTESAVASATADDGVVRAGLALPSPRPRRPDATPTLGTVVGAFKSLSAISCNRLLGRGGQPFWHRNYFERIIRNDVALDRARLYIDQNPANWSTDSDNAARAGHTP